MGGARHRPHHRCHLSDHRRGIRTHARRIAGRHRPGRRRGTGCVRQRPMAQLDARRTGRRDRRAVAGAAEARRRDRRRRHQRERRPASQSLGTQVFAATMVLDIYADIARSYPWSDERVGAMGQKVVVRRAPVGVCAGDHPVERAAVHHGDEARAVSRVRFDDGAQAGARDGTRPVSARRGGARGRPSAWRHQHRHRIAGGQRAHRHPPRRRQGQLHRFDGDGRTHRRALRRSRSNA